MSKMLFHTAKVAAFSRDDGTFGEMPISVYPNAHDTSDSISICWGISVDDAEALSAALLAAVKAVRGAVVPVPRGHCGRCDRCGWTFGTEPAQCRDGDCSMRPLPPYRQTCAGCGAPFETTPCIVDDCKNNGQFDGRCYFHDAAVIFPAGTPEPAAPSPDGQDVGKVRP